MKLESVIPVGKENQPDGTVFLEPQLNCDGVFNTGDVGLGGILVTIKKLDQPGQGEVRTTLTASDGTYAFEDLAPGFHEITVDKTTLAGLTASTLDVLVPDVPVGGDVTDQNFGFCPPVDCAPCEGKVTELTLRYDGAVAATIRVVQRSGGNNQVDAFNGVVQPGHLFHFVGQDRHGTFGPEIDIYVNGTLHTSIHTSCSQPIGPGLVKGSFTVITGKSRSGKALCAIGD